MKEHRAKERQRERKDDQWLLGDPLPAPPIEPESAADEIEDEQNYAAPSGIDLLRQQRESRWNEMKTSTPSTTTGAN